MTPESPILSLFVQGEPATKGDWKVTRSGKLRPGSKKTVPWVTTVGAVARARWGGRQPVTGPVALAIEFLMKRGKTVRRRYPSVPPDADKLLRAIGDALTSIVYKDDRQIVDAVVKKRYADDGQPQGVVITVWEME